MNYKGILFDMDGLLIDNAHHWENSHKDFFESRGFSADPPGLKEQMMGQSMEKSAKIMKDFLGLEESVDEIHRIRMEITDKIYTELSEAMDGTKELLESLLKTDYKKSIASGSPLYRVEMIVNRLNWHNYFDYYCGADQVDNVGKPAPDIYLFAAKNIGVSPESCVVFEDAPNGVLSGKSAGARVIAIPHKGLEDNEIFKKADLVVDSIHDQRVYDFLGIKKSV